MPFRRKVCYSLGGDIGRRDVRENSDKWWQEDEGSVNAIFEAISLLNDSLSIQSLLFEKKLQESQIQSSKTDAEGKKNH